MKQIVDPAQPHPKMRTFKGTITQDFKIVVSDEFIANMRAQSMCTVETELRDTEGRLIGITPPASPFLQQLQAQHPTNDEAFAEGLIKNALRTVHRRVTTDFLAKSQGIGGTLAPAQVQIVAYVPGHESPVNALVLDVAAQTAQVLAD